MNDFIMWCLFTIPRCIKKKQNKADRIEKKKRYQSYFTHRNIIQHEKQAFNLRESKRIHKFTFFEKKFTR